MSNMSDDLMARIMADAEDALAERANDTSKPALTRNDKVPNFFAWLTPASALAASVCAGLFIGLYTELPSDIGVLSSDAVQFSDAFGTFSMGDSFISEEQS